MMIMQGRIQTHLEHHLYLKVLHQVLTFNFVLLIKTQMEIGQMELLELKLLSLSLI